MPVFVRNLALDYLVEDGALNEERMIEMYRNSQWKHADGSYYLTHRLPSGVRFIFHALGDGEDVRIVGTDTHVDGRCVWHAVPFFNATPKDADELSAVVACTNQVQDGVFVTHLVNVALLPQLQEGEAITMQMVAFPFIMESYASREAYETAYRSDPGASRFPMLLTDRRVFPLNFMLKHDPQIPEEQRNRSLPDDVVLCCGPVLSVREAPLSDPAQTTSFSVATIATQFGHLDVAFVPEMCSPLACGKGSYVAFSGVLSGDVDVPKMES